MLIDDDQKPPPSQFPAAELPPYEHTSSVATSSTLTPSTYAAPAQPIPAPDPFPLTNPDNLPAAFARHPPPHLPYPPFAPVFLIAKGAHLNKGFPICPPPSTSQPHPFTTHDVSESDWIRLLEDIRTAATLTLRDMSIARSIPIIHILPVVGGLVEHAIKQHIKRRKSAPVSTVIDTWNHHFFHPRKLEVVLMHGTRRLSGDGPIPDADVFRNRLVLQAPSSGSISSSSTSFEETNNSASGPKQGPAKLERPGGGKKKKEKPDKTYRLFVVATT